MFLIWETSKNVSELKAINNSHNFFLDFPFCVDLYSETLERF